MKLKEQCTIGGKALIRAWFQRCFIFTILWCVIGCSSFTRLYSDDCDFAYSENIKSSVILPMLSGKIEKEMLPFINMDRPMLTNNGESTRLLFSPIKQIDGRMLMFENSFVFVFDNCSGKLMDFFEVIRN